jgi:hypothetical protein
MTIDRVETNKGSAAPIAYVERPLPAVNLGALTLFALVFALLGLGIWEGYWRGVEGIQPSYRNSDSAWTVQRRRISQGEGDATLVIGSSRMLFGFNLDQWQQKTGARPIQLALQGTSPIVVLEDLAKDRSFTGKLLIGVTPGLMFSGRGFRHNVVELAHKETRSQRFGHWLSQRLLEPHFAFYGDDEYALFTILERQAWPQRTGFDLRPRVRKISLSDADRQTRLWDRVERDPSYQALAKQIWSLGWRPIKPEDLEKHHGMIQREIQRAAAAVKTLRARGVPTIFVRLPSAGPFYQYEQATYPRATSWDVLLQASGAPGIHFEDHPSLQGLTLPEYSHLNSHDAKVATEAIAEIIEREALWLR